MENFSQKEGGDIAGYPFLVRFILEFFSGVSENHWEENRLWLRRGKE